MKGGLIFVSVESPQSQTPLHFILDSGAGVSVLNLRTVRRLALPLAAQAAVRGVGSETSGHWPQHLTATAGSVPLPTNFLAVDLSKLSDACESSVDGLIGLDFFEGRIVQIDYSNRLIHVLNSFSPPARFAALPLKRGRQSLLTKVEVKGHSTEWLRVDTGCASQLEWVDSTKKYTDAPYQIAVGLSAITKAEAEVAIRLGGLEFESIRTGIHPAPIFRGEMGLVGNGLLARFKSVTFDAGKRRIYLEPLSELTAP